MSVGAPVPQPKQPLARPGVISIAALAFQNVQREPRWSSFEIGIADAFVNSIIRRGRFRVVERTQIDRAIEELRFDQTEYVDASMAQKLGHVIGAQYLVIGSFQVFGGQMRLNARLMRVETAEIVAAQTLTGNTADALQLPDHLAQQLLKGLD